MGEFKKLNHKIFGRKTFVNTPDALYWKKLGVPSFLKEFGPVDYIDFSPLEPHYFAVTSSVRIQVYSPVTRLVHKNLSRFQKSAYGGSFRSDGKLLCAGGEENLVKLFDVSSKALLRVFEGHTEPVHRCFFTVDNTQLVSFSDDRHVKVWDIPSEKSIASYSVHSDYIRAGAVSPISPDVILSGSYDGVVKLYDKRSDSVIFSLNHGFPVESVMFLPNGGIFLSAGGIEIRVWDAFYGGRQLARLCHHHKTVTCLRLASKGSRILSGSLDRHLNIYDVTTFQRVHSIDYPNSILSMGISANDEIIAVGMVDGLVSVSKRETGMKASSSQKRQEKFKYAPDPDTVTADVLIKEKKGPRLAKHDAHLRKFEHSKALKAVLAAGVQNKSPEVTAAMLQELMYRKALHAAVGGNEAKVVVLLLRFLIKYLGDYRFTRLLIEVANVFMDVYEDSIIECGPEAMNLFLRLSGRLKEELELTESLLVLKGSVDLMVSASTSANSKISVSTLPVLKPSESARDFVVHVS